ncbi:MAG: 6-phosphogluconolactonase [Actinomycetota bacterium]
MSWSGGDGFPGELVVLDDQEAVARRAVELFLQAEPRKVCLAGGRTPRRAYELLAASEFPWGETEVFLTDERCLPPGDPGLNWTMITESLLSRVPARGHRVATELPPDEAAAAYEQEVRAALPFDVTILGLGADGHTASLFPGDLDPAPGRLVATSWSAETRARRITLTLEAINQSEQVVFLVVGAEKAEALRGLVSGAPIPGAKVRARRSPTLLCDRPAARLLT